MLNTKYKNLKNYFYRLPEHLIAQYPLTDREQARLMVIEKNKKKITHDYFYNLKDYLPQTSTLVFNNSKVLPARLLGVKERSGGKVELFLLNRHKNGSMYKVLMRPEKKIKEGDKIEFNGTGLSAQIIDKQKRIIKFNKQVSEQDLTAVGHMPLPPYIKRCDNRDDKEYYQTVYARHRGSVASPTAGLHFTKSLLKDLECDGHILEKVTLHINYATFKPVEEKDITLHRMHKEKYSISDKVYDRLCQKKNGQKIVAVGTTSCRVLETVARNGNNKGETDLYLYPGKKFQATDILITNFHQPYSSLLMLVSAFASSDLIKKAYREAVKEKYRFLSYGDAMIII